MALMERYGYPGIFFLIAVENIFPPIPSEIILPFGGFLTTYTRLSIFHPWLSGGRSGALRGGMAAEPGTADAPGGRSGGEGTMS